MRVPCQPLSRLARCVFAACAAVLTLTSAHAVVLDWDTNSWTNANNGSPLPNSYDVDGVAGADLTLSLSGQLAKLRSEPVSGTNTPAVMSTLTGSTAEKSLHFYASVGTQTEITVSVSFAATYVQGVENVSFTLFDIDKTTDSEFIKNIYGIALNGTLIAATVTDLGSSVAISGPGTLAQQLTGIAPAADGSANGNATISFGTNVIRGFAFTFDNSQGPPRIQEFAMHDINFTPVPEVNPAWLAAAACGLFGVARPIAGYLRKRRGRLGASSLA